jgi:DNA-binding NarL/FixJ family response regulator
MSDDEAYSRVTPPELPPWMTMDDKQFNAIMGKYANLSAHSPKAMVDELIRRQMRAMFGTSVSPWTKAKVLELRAAGASYGQIAKALKIGKGTAHKIVREAEAATAVK